MVKRIRECRGCGGNVIEWEDARYGLYSQCLQCGHEAKQANPREVLTRTVNRGRALPGLSPIRTGRGQAWQPF